MWPAKHEQSDQALVRAFLRHRRERDFRALYRRHTPIMVRMAHKAAANQGMPVDDMVQEAWVRGIRNLPAFEWRSTLSSWLCGIVINVAREARRTEYAGFLSPMTAEDAGVVDIWIDPVDALTLSGAVGALPEGYRSIIALHDIAGFTHEEIGTILGIDPGTSKSQLARGRQRLREMLDRPEGGQW